MSGSLAAVPAPILLTSLTSAALLDGQGDLELVRETRGVPVDWGGVYAQSVRLTGPWTVRLADEHGLASLPSLRTGAERVPGGFATRHDWNGLRLDQEVVAIADPPGAVRTLRIRAPPDSGRAFHLVSEFSPFLLPVTVEGIRPVTFHAETTPSGFRVLQRGFGLECRSDRLFDRLYLNRASWRGGSYDGRIDTIGSAHDVALAAGGSWEIHWAIAGGLARSLKGSESAFRSALESPAELGAQVDAADRAWTDSSPELDFPQAPALTGAYRVARAGLRRLYCAPGDDLAGLSAGYPWYSAIWCRDLAWMLPAVLWLGDVDWAVRSIASVFRYQGRTEVPILGGEPGELPMQIAPGPVFLYGTSDTTLYYPELILRVARHGGRAAVPTEWTLPIQRILAWGRARSDAETGLLRHGGEVASISAASAALARIRFGIDAKDTTIWDSTDRRDHAIDIQALWWRTLVSAAEWFGRDDDLGRPAAALADRLRATLGSRYPWPEERYLYDSWRNDAPVARLRPNALRAISAGLVDDATARACVRRAHEEDLTTSWGVRTLSNRDVGYRPDAYHDGQVWPIATAWAADAAIAAGELPIGYEYLDTLAQQLVQGGGAAFECYRGDRAEPFDSCFLLGFSVGPFVNLLFERVWGLEVDANVPALAVRPTFPPEWRSATIRRLRIGGGRAALAWNAGRLSVSWEGGAPLRVTTRSGSAVVEPDRSVVVVAPTAGDGTGVPERPEL